MINSAISLRSSRSQSISSKSIKSNSLYYYQKNDEILTGKRKLENNLGQSTKRKKSSDNDTRYITKELDFDINCATLN
ncbi:unnamed protein product [Rhizophagus irregularis]|uniref:Uncharacterized protein n=1 Tax=Rhizophagus irregularis TaxID=588596 RepID=A0A915Z3W6_9GLOM|nr:unnamed protein product [Rhizophagus irregularis]CAB5359729.1 unnamed protein product [Rhizophagus irregularis]